VCGVTPGKGSGALQAGRCLAAWGKVPDAREMLGDGSGAPLAGRCPGRCPGG
jgi:hypothetical protein